MPTLSDLTKPANQKRFHAELKARFPEALYGSRRDLSTKLTDDFDAVMAAGSEEAMQKLIVAHPYLLQYAFRTTGHHGTWAYPKRWIRTHQASGQSGLIPDFVAAMRNSLGYSWQIIELKRPDVQFANKRGDGLSTEAHKALAQCGEYVSHFADYIENVRMNVGDERISQPDGVTIVIGDSRIESDAQRRVRANFQALSPKISIATYDRLRRGLLNDVNPSALAQPEFDGAEYPAFLG
jgi:hypothetical protein